MEEEEEEEEEKKKKKTHSSEKYMKISSVFSYALQECLIPVSCVNCGGLTTLVVIVRRDDGRLTDEAECKC